MRLCLPLMYLLLHAAHGQLVAAFPQSDCTEACPRQLCCTKHHTVLSGCCRILSQAHGQSMRTRDEGAQSTYTGSGVRSTQHVGCPCAPHIHYLNSRSSGEEQQPRATWKPSWKHACPTSCIVPCACDCALGRDIENGPLAPCACWPNKHQPLYWSSKLKSGQVIHDVNTATKSRTGSSSGSVVGCCQLWYRCCWRRATRRSSNRVHIRQHWGREARCRKRQAPRCCLLLRLTVSATVDRSIDSGLPAEV